MVGTLKDLEKTDDVGVANFLKKVDFLKEFALGVLIFHERLVHRLDGHFLLSEFVDSECDFSKGAFTNQLDELVEFDCSLRQALLRLRVRSDVLY
jgi:hypothetical protein